MCRAINVFPHDFPNNHIGLSGLRANQMQLNITANNIANISTPKFQEKMAILTESANGGVAVTNISPAIETNNLLENNVNLANQMINLKSQEIAYNMNAKTIKAQNDMIGSLINTIA